MTLYSITGSVTSLGIPALATGDVVLVTEDADVLDPTGILFAPVGTTNVTFSVAGDVLMNGMGLGSGSRLSVASTGSLSLLSPSEGLSIDGSNSLLVNDGLIESLTNSAINMTGSLGRIQNTGLIRAPAAAVFLHGNTLENQGQILGMTGVVAIATRATIVNGGVIQGTNGAIFLDGDDLASATAANFVIFNEGNLVSSLSNTISSSLDVSASAVMVVNSGLIQGPIALNFGGISADRIVNRGEINGSMILLGGSDFVDNRGGTISGDIFLGAGADFFDGSDGNLFGFVDGGTGSDSYRLDSQDISINESGSDIDSVFANCTYRLSSLLENLALSGGQDWRGFGNSAANSLTGNIGDNRLCGLEGNDTQSGQSGNDTVAGNGGNDSLTGDDGDDILNGGSGNDTLVGGDGDDLLIGGLGTDALFGGNGADEFRFLNGASLAAQQSRTDIISGFTKGEDIINLAGIDAKTDNALSNDTFTFIATAAFSNVAGQLRFSSGTLSTVVEMDLDGNSTPDLVLMINSVVTLAAADFIL